MRRTRGYGVGGWDVRVLGGRNQLERKLEVFGSYFEREEKG